MDEKEINKIEQDLLADLDSDLRIEKEIKEKADEISRLLEFRNRVKADIDGKQFLIQYRIMGKDDKQKIYMMAANTVLFALADNKYVPFTITVDMDTRYSLRENLSAAIEAFIRHLTDRIKPEFMEE